MDKVLIGILEKISELYSDMAKSDDLIYFKYDISLLNTDIGKKLVAHLGSIDRYSIFNKYIQYIGNFGSHVEISNLASWLIFRTLSTNAELAECNLRCYLESDNFSAFKLVLLANINTDDEFVFFNGVRLARADSFDNFSFKRDVWSNYGNSMPTPRIKSILCQKILLEKNHYPNTDFESSPLKIEISYDDMESVRLALILIRPGYGVHSIAKGVAVTDDIPALQSISGWYLDPYKLPPIGPSLIKVNLYQADNIAKSISDLDPKTRKKMKISIERLNGYYSGNSNVDNAIDLRVCMESIFLNDGNKDQLKLSLSIRAAHFLGGDLDEKRKIRETFKKAYDVTSTAVHNGIMPSKNSEFLKDAALYSRSAILKYIEVGEVNWNDVELGI